MNPDPEEQAAANFAQGVRTNQRKLLADLKPQYDFAAPAHPVPWLRIGAPISIDGGWVATVSRREQNITPAAVPPWRGPSRRTE